MKHGAEHLVKSLIAFLSSHNQLLQVNFGRCSTAFANLRKPDSKEQQ